MEKSKIQWTDHTFNPWIGCSKVHTGCKHCYAEELMDTRYKRVEWGPNGTRSRTKTWRDPVRWNKQATGQTRPRVFCASLADVFEDRAELVPWRRELFELIDKCPRLDWLLLTKRPENVVDMWLCQGCHGASAHGDKCCQYCHGESINRGMRSNVWIGTSVSDQRTADKFIPRLFKNRDLCKILFLSIEPIIGPVDLAGHLDEIDWVIVGGESGHGARPVRLQWFANIVRQCRLANVPVFVKQMGENIEDSRTNGKPFLGPLDSKKGDLMEEMPPSIRVRQWPGLETDSKVCSDRTHESRT